MLAVTSFSEVGWKKYAREGVETFIKHWPGTVVALYEKNRPELDGTLLNATSTGKLLWADLFQDHTLMSMLGWCARIPEARGETPNGGYNFHRDIFKFSRKTFAVRMAMNLAGTKAPLFWLDADVRWTEDVPETVLEGMFATGDIAYLGRKGAPHSECGFIGFNVTKEPVQEFINRWAGAYVDGSVLDLPGWHDCWVFDALLKLMKIPANNLTELVSNGNAAEAVFEKSILGKYGTHLKGARKGKEAA
jgi:hypothetical protein